MKIPQTKHALHVVDSIWAYLASGDAPAAKVGDQGVEVLSAHAEQRAQVLRGACGLSGTHATAVCARSEHQSLHCVERVG